MFSNSTSWYSQKRCCRPAHSAAHAARHASGWSERQATLLRATDELVDARRIGDETWGAIERELSVVQRIELCMLAGHYAMLAGTLNSLGVERDRATA